MSRIERNGVNGERAHSGVVRAGNPAFPNSCAGNAGQGIFGNTL